MPKENSPQKEENTNKEEKQEGKKKKKKSCFRSCLTSLLGVIVVISIIAGGLYFWSKKNTEDLSAVPKAYIASVEGEVLWQSSGKEGVDDWVKAKEQAELSKGDKIKTEEGSEATLIFFDNSVVHVGPGSEITIKEGSINQENHTSNQVALEVQAGRVWARILQLVDKDASFEIESSNTVATVRGTAFDFQVLPDQQIEITAAESEIEVTTATDQTFLAEETETVIGQSQKIAVKPASEEKLQTDWFTSQKEKDKKYLEKIANKRKKALKRFAGALPGSKLYEAKIKAEYAKLFLAKDKPKKLYPLAANFIKRRLAEAQVLTEKGEIQLAKEVLQDLESLLTQHQDQVRRPEVRKFRLQVKNQIEMQQLLMLDVTEQDKAYPVKQALERIELKIAVDKKDQFFSRIRQLENRLKEDRILEKKGQKVFCKKLAKYQEKLNKIVAEKKDLPFEKRLAFTEFKIKIFKEKYCSPDANGARDRLPGRARINQQQSSQEEDGKEEESDDESDEEEENEEDDSSTGEVTGEEVKVQGQIDQTDPNDLQVTEEPAVIIDNYYYDIDVATGEQLR